MQATSRGCVLRHLRAHTCTQHTTRTMAGLLNMAGLSLTGAFAGAQLRAPTPAARVSHTGFSVVAVRAFRRSQLFPSRDSRIAFAHARRARAGTLSTPANAREGTRTFFHGAGCRAARLSTARVDPRTPYAAHVARARVFVQG